MSSCAAPISWESLAARSDASISAVPDFAMVPISATTSSRVMPIPLSRTVIVRASASAVISTCRSDVSACRSLSR